MITEVGRWMHEAVDTNVPGLTADAINDAIEDLWMLVIRSVISELLGGPVQLAISPAMERTQLVSVADPVAAPNTAFIGGGAGVPPRHVFIVITLATESGTETNISPESDMTSAIPNQLVQVQPPTFVPGAFGYNVYAFVANLATPAPLGPQSYFRQNTDPIDFSAVFTEPSSGFIYDAEGNPPGPQFNSTADNIFYIHHLETLTPDGTYAAWNQADIDSNLMRRAARSLPEVSPYANFLFDYISGGTLELRPPVGQGANINPRYFFVNKPRKLRYANAPIPLAHIPSAWPYIRFKAMSLLKLASEEYQASSMWAGNVQALGAAIMQSINKKTANRNNRVTPFLRGGGM